MIVTPFAQVCIHISVASCCLVMQLMGVLTLLRTTLLHTVSNAAWHLRHCTAQFTEQSRNPIAHLSIRVLTDEKSTCPWKQDSFYVLTKDSKGH